MANDKPTPVALDLDAKRRARPQRDPLVLKIAGKRYTLPKSIPLDIIDVVVGVMNGRADAIDDCLGYFFGKDYGSKREDGTWDRKEPFASLELEDLSDIFEAI